MSSLTKTENSKKDILIFYKEKMYSINFAEHNKKFCLNLHYNGANSYLFINGTEIHKFNAKDSKVVATPLCLGKNSKDWSIDIMKITGLNGYVYDFSVDYNAIAFDDLLDIRKYLMKKKRYSIKYLGFLRKYFLQQCFWLKFIKGNPVNALNCVSMNNQECKIRLEIVTVNNDEPVFFLFSIKTSKCNGSCNNINDPFAKLCVPDVKNINLKVFNLISKTSEMRHIKFHETCKCRLVASVCNDKDGREINANVNVKN